MADYYPLLAKAVAGLDPNTPEARDGIYQRARSALRRQLAGIEPPVPEMVINREMASLEDVFLRIEAECAADPEQAPEPNSLASSEPVVPSRPRPQLRKKPKTEGDTRKPMLAAALALGAMVVFAIAILAFLRRDQPPAIAAGRAPATAQTSAVVNDPSPVKASDRVRPGSTEPIETPATPIAKDAVSTPASQEARPVPQPAPTIPSRETARPSPSTTAEAPVSTAPPPRTPAPAIAVANRATLLLQGTSANDQVLVRQGSVIWRRETVSGGQNETLDQAVKAIIEIPESKTTAEVMIQRNRDAAFPASHTIQIRFQPVAGSEIPVVQSLTTFELRQNENQTGYALAGQGITVMDNVFLLALAQIEPTRSRNEDMMKSRPLLYFEFSLAGGRRGAILMEKGISGQAAFDDAFRSWQ